MSAWLAMITASLIGGTALYTTLRGFSWWWALPRRARVALALLPVALLLAAGVARGADGGAPAERCPSSTFYLVGSIDSTIVPYLESWLAGAGRSPLLIIDSPGGTMEASTQVYEAVKRHGGVRCRVQRLAASGAFAVLQACAVREMGRDSILATHEPRILWPRPLNRANVQELAQFLEAASETWNAMCRARLRISAETYNAYVRGKDWVMKSPEALAAGAIDRVL